MSKPEDDTQKILGDSPTDDVARDPFDRAEVRATAKAAHGVIEDLMEQLEQADDYGTTDQTRRTWAAANAVLRRLSALGEGSE